MLNTLISILGAIFAFVLVIIIHEWGHFFVAKCCKVKILKFSIGFGKALWSHTANSGTQYIIALLPLGGYVRMLGESDAEVTPENQHQAFNQRPLLARMAIVLAGPVMNFILAIFLFWLIFMQGVHYIKPVIGQVAPKSIAARAGMEKGQKIVAVNHQQVLNWQQVLMALLAKVGSKGELPIQVQTQAGQLQQLQLNINQWQVNTTKPQLFHSLGFKPFYPKVTARVLRVQAGSPAAHAGLKTGDVIAAIDGKLIDDWMEAVKAIQQRPNQLLVLKVKRKERFQVVRMRIATHELAGKKVGFLGVVVVPPKWPKAMLSQHHYSLLAAWHPAWQQVWRITTLNFIALKKIILGEMSVRSLGGPITIATAAGKASHEGLKTYLGLIAFISITLGFINLLPIPALDGGHFLFQMIEAIIRRPVSEQAQNFCLKLGFLFIILLIAIASTNDIVRLFL